MVVPVNSNCNEPEGVSSFQNDLQCQRERKILLDNAHGIPTAWMHWAHIISLHLHSAERVFILLTLDIGPTGLHKKNAREPDDCQSSLSFSFRTLPKNNPNTRHTAKVQPSWEGCLEYILPNKPCHGQRLEAKEPRCLPCSDGVACTGAKCLPAAWTDWLPGQYNNYRFCEPQSSGVILTLGKKGVSTISPVALAWGQTQPSWFIIIRRKKHWSDGLHSFNI